MTATAFAALVVILLGWLLRRLGVLTPAAGPALVKIVIYLTLPALVFHIMVTREMELSLVLVPVVGFAVHGVLVALAWGLARVRRLDRRATGALIVASAVGNTGFFGIPLIAAATDAHLSLPAAVMFDTFCTGIITWTSTMWFGARFGDRDASGDAPAGGLKNLIMLPPIWAVIAGMAVHAAGVDELPAAIDRPLLVLGGAVLPLVLIYAGLVIEWDGVRRAWRDVAWATALRFLASPLIALAVAFAIGLDDDVLRTVVLQAAMPTAMMSLVIGGWFRLKTDVIAGAVVVTALLAPIVLPGALWLVGEVL